MRLSGVRAPNEIPLRGIKSELTYWEFEGKVYVTQWVERVDAIQSRKKRITLNGRDVWRDGAFLVRTKAGRWGFVIEPGDRIEEHSK